jgi:hypothetical protein
MRKLINIINENQQPPAILYHGTPTENLILIFKAGYINANECDEGPTGVSWTSEFKVAASFAHADSRDGDLLHSEILFTDNPRFEGVVFEAQSAALGHLEEYDWGEDGEHSEGEWRTKGNVPLSAISKIYMHRRELEQYRDTFLDAQKNYTVKAWDEIDPEYKPHYLQWATEFLTDADRKLLSAMEAILSDPRVVPYA